MPPDKENPRGQTFSDIARPAWTYDKNNSQIQTNIPSRQILFQPEHFPNRMHNPIKDTSNISNAQTLSLGSRVRWLWPRSAYVHIPFCNHHCGYCDFAVSTGQDDKIDQYLDALEAELATTGGPHPVETLFLGGGTPTYINAQQLERLLGMVRSWFSLEHGAEFSVEANPGTLTPEKIRLLADHEINRVSLGGQSFHPHLLKVLERDHQPADVSLTIDRLRPHVNVVSLDLIFGVPGQTNEEWRSDLRQALSLPVDHISTYGLTFEKGTRLWKQMREGKVHPLEETNEREMYLLGIDILETHGFEHYEISNFAKPGKACRHNGVYWANEAYFGIGMGAASYIRGKRELNTRSLESYIERALGGKSTRFQSEELSPEERALETIGQNLRRKEGIARHRFREQTGFALEDVAGSTIERFVASGHLADDEVSVRLTREGKCVADYIIQQFW